ncbi:MAG TPA: glucans biosynthesis glucosyltransferase MdoH [Caldimonas sp.]|jgi:membrane glycosyltransferase|nr:glucans biosynthesis glucosyltransferase MdoH [Caldimonas sp.]HEX2541594.1 glucans biosynthesis glucosyltransferase MdoH [Caldimonas sp.]
MTGALPQPALSRQAMVPEPWAGHPLGRLFQRLLGRSARRPARRASDRRPPMLRRLVLLVLVLIGAYVGTQAMTEVLPEHGTAFAEKCLLVLFGILFAWISAGFWTAMMGAWVLVFGRGASPLMRALADEPVRPLDPAARTAIVMPICNEHVPTVFGGLAATIDSLVATGESDRFDVYVLSDTSDPDIRAAEHAAYTDLARRLSAEAGGDGDALRLHYRWRQRRTRRKTGNVADFCRRWGGAYRYFVVLDADSIMTGECLTTLVRLMEVHTDAGIIQTAPKAVGHETFHARVQQFCAHAYGPLFTAGMRFWQMGESHYWGHNAIIRMAPFVAHCGLAPLPGEGTLSGEIMSHDFVEAALMRRAGWKVWVADEIEGSYEQVPPNLVAELQRDRRWCHGNLQNSRLMFEPRLHAVHRTAFLTGVLAYLSSPLWLAFLVLSTLLFAQHTGNDPAYFIEPYQLFPIWPTANLKLMLTLFGLTGMLLLAPKVLSLIAIVMRGEAKRFGGPRALFTSAFIEFLHSMLLAPVRMVFHTQFVLAALTGWRLAWKSPPRDDRATSWSEAWARHGAHTILAIAWIGAIVLTSSAFPWWLSPILLGLLGATFLSVWGSRREVGLALKKRSLLLTPDETRVPPVLDDAAGEAARADAELATFRRAVGDARTLERVLGALPARPVAIGAKGVAEAARVERALREGPAALSDDDRLRLLSSAPALRHLHDQVRVHHAHPEWWNAADVPGSEAPSAEPLRSHPEHVPAL